MSAIIPPRSDERLTGTEKDRQTLIFIDKKEDEFKCIFKVIFNVTISVNNDNFTLEIARISDYL